MSDDDENDGSDEYLRNDDVWSDGKSDDLEELLEALGIEPDSIFSSTEDVVISTQTHFVEEDGNGRRYYVIIDDESGAELRELLPRWYS